jgi:hypothetical protein
MPLTELIDYIREQTQQGVSAEALREELMEAGWHQTDIENALHDVAAGLHPVTAGASIHEDLAQVRGMVAHLATRVRTLEAHLASVGVLGAPAPMAVLPGGTPDASHTLSRAHRPGRRVVMTIAAALVCAAAGWYAASLIDRSGSAPVSWLMVAAASGLVLMAVSVILMRRGKGWAASILAALAVAVWAVDTIVAWRFWRMMEWTTALALGVLLLVVAVVAARWSDRLSK